MENLTSQVADSTQELRVSSLAMSTWPGNHNFQVSFPCETQFSRKVDYTYSASQNKLYVLKDILCPIHFATDFNLMPAGTIIRAMAVYSQPDHVSEVVRRCINHTAADQSIGVLHPDHLVQCGSEQAVYERDGASGHYSVIVPYENPQAGESYSTYLYKFVCWGSCSGGINRKPVTLILTLEHGGQVLGRQSIHLRICACPGRDRRADEMQVETNSERKKKGKAERKPSSDLNNGNIADIMNFAQGIMFPVATNITLEPDTPEGDYIITATSPAMYEFLKQMEVFYKICNRMRNVPPELSRAISNCDGKLPKLGGNESGSN